MELATSIRQEWDNGLPPAIPPGLEEAAQNKVYELYDQLQEWMSGQDADQRRLDQGLKDFLMISDRKVYPWQSNFLMPTVYNAVRMTWARFLSSVLNAPKLAEIKPFGMIQTGFVGDYEELEFRSRLADSAFNASLELSDTRADIAVGALDGLIYGRNWTKTGWITNGRPDGQGGLEIESEWPRGIRLSPYNVYKDPYCGMDILKARGIKEILELTIEQLRALSRSNQFIPSSWESCQEARQGTTNSYRQRANDRERVGNLTRSGYFEIVEDHCYWDHDGDGTPTPWIFWYDLQLRKVLGCRELPFEHGQFPYQLGTPLPIPDMGFGMGLARALHPQMHGASSTVNQLQENVAAMNMRHLIVSGAGIDEVALSKSIPNGIIRTEDINAWKPMQGQGMPSDTWNFLSFWAGLSQETSGVTPLTMAMKAASTAYGTSAVQSNAQENFDTITTAFSLTWLRPMLKQLFRNTQQFLDMSVLVNMPVKGFEDKKVPISREDIQGSFRVEPYDLRLYGKKMQRAQQAQALLSQLVQLKLPANYQWIVEQIFEDMELYDADQAFKGTIYNPILEEARAQAAANAPQMQAMGPQGIRGQSTPNTVQPSQPALGSSRVNLRPMPGGAMPVSLQGQLGGGEPQ